MDECEHNEPNITLLDLTNDENDVDNETMSGMQAIYIRMQDITLYRWKITLYLNMYLYCLKDLIRES